MKRLMRSLGKGNRSQSTVSTPTDARRDTGRMFGGRGSEHMLDSHDPASDEAINEEINMPFPSWIVKAENRLSGEVSVEVPSAAPSTSDFSSSSPHEHKSLLGERRESTDSIAAYPSWIRKAESQLSGHIPSSTLLASSGSQLVACKEDAEPEEEAETSAAEAEARAPTAEAEARAPPPPPNRGAPPPPPAFDAGESAKRQKVMVVPSPPLPPAPPPSEPPSALGLEPAVGGTEEEVAWAGEVQEVAQYEEVKLPAPPEEPAPHPTLVSAAEDQAAMVLQAAARRRGELPATTRPTAEEGGG
eukprot:CAMPEP_0174701206 /NCGR_PEP_ID=MMETSP1094-20130205/5919_1 /TAXON_ID=156173 /ORGANISM="Chrysochromulina brevifilum, Strain UTEX LB 985" /LENGTH=301 /DNA_ID=CAMNT_0015898813 /DNA_START=65 /DNA_END=966 /DNA_ORIENTATION=-